VIATRPHAGPGSKARAPGLFLAGDEISPLYGKSWREIGLDGLQIIARRKSTDSGLAHS